jgi:hypothetical protein
MHPVYFRGEEEGWLGKECQIILGGGSGSTGEYSGKSQLNDLSLMHRWRGGPHYVHEAVSG